MHRFLLTLTAAATVLATGALVPNRVEASPLSASMGINLPVGALAPIENVAVCFYADGWNGPGLYECGSHRRQGFGWHGPRVGDGRVGDGRNGRVDRDRRGHQSDGPSIHLQTDGRGRY
jgi:hypothetical protein